MKYDCYYSDTDSIFISEELPDYEMGFDLGKMKDELNGLTIDKAIFLGIKEYGYQYTNKDGEINNKSVFSGIPRNLLSFQEVEDIFNDKIIIKKVPTRFFKSFKDLSIVTKDITISVKKKTDKILINNNYIPKNIIELEHFLDNRNIFNKLKNKIIKLLKYFNL